MLSLIASESKRKICDFLHKYGDVDIEKGRYFITFSQDYIDNICVPRNIIVCNDDGNITSETLKEVSIYASDNVGATISILTDESEDFELDSDYILPTSYLDILYGLVDYAKTLIND